MTLIQTPSPFVGFNGLSYQVAPNETLFFTPYVHSIYSNLVHFYLKDQYVQSGLVIKDKTILTTSDLPEWDRFILSESQLPKIPYTIEKKGTSTALLTFEQSFPTSSAQINP
jgi:hypothetical protein